MYAIRSYYEIHPNLFLILVPRRPERVRQVGDEFARLGLHYVLRTLITAGMEPLQSGEVLLVDTVGEMLIFYAMADIVFVGGSLVPVGGRITSYNVCYTKLLRKL